MRYSFELFFLFVLYIIVSTMLSLSPEHRCCEQVKKAKVEKPKLSYEELLAKKMGETPRLEKLGLLPGEGKLVILPTVAYLKKLNAACRDWVSGYQTECERRIGEVKKGYQDVTSRVDPIYGRPQFTKEQLAYVRWGERRTLELLQGVESDFVIINTN